MSDLLDFEAYKLRRNSDPDTSHEAAESLELTITKLQGDVFKVIEKAGMKGLTIKELCSLLPGTSGGTYSSRPNELIKAKLCFHVVGDKRKAGGKGRAGNVIRASKYKKKFREEDGLYYFK
jgi:hypothetical protein